MTPFFTLTFIERPTRLYYSRYWYEWLSLAASALALAALLVLAVRPRKSELE